MGGKSDLRYAYTSTDQTYMNALSQPTLSIQEEAHLTSSKLAHGNPTVFLVTNNVMVVLREQILLPFWK